MELKCDLHLPSSFDFHGIEMSFLTVHANKPLDVALAMNSERSYHMCEPNNERSLQVACAYDVCTVRCRRTYT